MQVDTAKLRLLQSGAPRRRPWSSKTLDDWQLLYCGVEDDTKANVALALAAVNTLEPLLNELDRLRRVEEKAEAIPATPGGRSLADWGNYFNRYMPANKFFTEDDMNELSDLFCALVDLAAALKEK